MKRDTAEKKAYRAAKLVMYKRDGYRCRSCNSSDSLTPHHIVFRSQLGPDDVDNLLTLCIQCHIAVHDRFLLIDVTDGAVRFIRVKGWRPQ
jgi:5-methylcytosine-specific restriction endonuclease McrA